MRLIRIALANVNTTVGARALQRRPRVELARAAAADDATARGVSRAADRRLPAGRSGAVARLRRRAVDRARALRRRRPRALAAVFVLGVTVARGPQRLQLRGAGAPRQDPRPGAQGEAAHLQRLLRGAHVRARRRRAATTRCTACRSAIWSSTSTSARSALEVCEDIWSPDGPMRRRCYAGAELVVNLSASPFRLGVVDTRREMICTRAGDNQCVVAYAEPRRRQRRPHLRRRRLRRAERPPGPRGAALPRGLRRRSTVDLDRTRRLRAREHDLARRSGGFARRAPQIARVDGRRTDARGATSSPIRRRAHQSFFLPAPTATRTPRAEFCEDLLDALALGVGDYFEKTGAFKTIGVALSGGRDSLLCLIIARRWVERRFGASASRREAKAREILRAFFMPTRYSSTETHARGRAGGARTSTCRSRSSPIDDAFERELEAIEKMLQPGETLTPMARQNVQARMRAERMWTWTNCAGGLFLQTSNMSEKAVGYTTIGGDMEGALAVIANLPEDGRELPARLSVREDRLRGHPPDAGEAGLGRARRRQEDEKDLMPFPVLDACFALYAGEKMSPDEVSVGAARDVPRATTQRSSTPGRVKFARLFTQSIYKWVQTPLSLHVGNLDLDRERALQLPVVQRTEWQNKDNEGRDHTAQESENFL